MYGRRAVSTLRESNAPDAALMNIILDCAAVMGLDLYKDVVEHLHLTRARDVGGNDTPHESEFGAVCDMDPSGCPFPLLSFCHETGKWSISENAASIMATITERANSDPNLARPLRVIGAVGGIRKGKSYFLNRVAGRQTGFGVGDDATPSCTEGVWAWFLPETNIVLLDTAG